MGTALFLVIYTCFAGSNLGNVCIETHARFPDDAVSAEDCATLRKKFRVKDRTDTRAYCNVEKDGPDYGITYDLDRNTTTYNLLPPSKR